MLDDDDGWKLIFEHCKKISGQKPWQRNVLWRKQVAEG